jgi:hypothetical protein
MFNKPGFVLFTADGLTVFGLEFSADPYRQGKIF